MEFDGKYPQFMLINIIWFIFFATLVGMHILYIYMKGNQYIGSLLQLGISPIRIKDMDGFAHAKMAIL